MAGERTLPGIGMTAFWDPGSDGWDTGMDLNLLTLSVLVQGRVLSRTTSLPGSPSAGDTYIVPSGAGSHPNEVAIYDDGAWVYLTPAAGWRLYVADLSTYYYYTGSAWAVSLVMTAEIAINTQTGTSYTAVLTDTGKLVTMSNASANVFNIPLNSSVAFPVGTMLTVKYLGAGQTSIDSLSTVTLNGVSGGGCTITGQYSTAVLTKIGTDAWTIDGPHGTVA